MFPMLFKSKQTGGITYTNNGDGSLTINGTAISFEPQTVELDVPLPAGTYRLWAGNDKAVSGANAFLGVRTSDGADKGLNLVNVGASALISTDIPITKLFLNIFTGAVVDNITIRPQLEIGSVSTDYEPYKPITETDIVFPSPVYGGTLDVVSGVLTVEWVTVRADAFSWETSILTSKGQAFMTTGSVSVPFAPWQNEKGQAFAMSNALIKNSFAGNFDDAPANSFWWNNGRSGYRCVFDQNASVQDLMQFFTDNDVIFCGKLAEPFEITLTPEQITALVGNNTIWSDADGSMTAVYLKKG